MKKYERSARELEFTLGLFQDIGKGLLLAVAGGVVLGKIGGVLEAVISIYAVYAAFLLLNSAFNIAREIGAREEA